MGRPCVLIVDDNRDLADNLSEILDDAGFQTRVYSDPRMAMVDLQPGEYAAALLDMRMPGMNGVELYRALRQKDPALPAIAMTAYVHEDTVRAAIHEGISAVLAKPVDFKSLLARVSSVTEGLRVLIVEDDADLAHNLGEIFTMHGLSPRVVHTAAEARQVAAALHPDVLVLDVKLPDADGAALLNELTAGRTNCVRLLISAFAPDAAGTVSAAVASGAAYMDKPLDVQAMVALLKSAKRAQP